jgi:D-sedoheptulose 7-phosphate isomerase
VSTLAESIRRKAKESAETIERTFAEQAERVETCARAMAAAFDGGGRLFVMGNGGSAADAMHVAVEFMHPIIERRPPIPAIALPADAALMTAIANDQDFTLAWTHALRVHGKRGDVALALSTSGHSASVNRSLTTARGRRTAVG